MPKADLDISMLFDCDSMKPRTVNVIEIANRRRYTCCEHDGDGLVGDAGQNVTFSTLVYHGECRFWHRVAELGGLLGLTNLISVN